MPWSLPSHGLSNTRPLAYYPSCDDGFSRLSRWLLYVRAHYLRWLLAFFRGNVSLVAAAYNSGERTVEKYRGIPPYPETLNYVKKVNSFYQKPTHPFQRNLVSSSTVVMRQTLGFH